MKVFKTTRGWVDVYFKTEASGNQFVNYINTLSGEELQLNSVELFTTIVERRGVGAEFLYTLANYVHEDTTNSYLELFPEERE